MNLLLLLSALLSAITGVTAGGQRAPVAAERVVRAGQAASAARAVVALPGRTMVPAFDMAVRRAVAALVRLPVVTIPAYATRRRE